MKLTRREMVRTGAAAAAAATMISAAPALAVDPNAAEQLVSRVSQRLIQLLASSSSMSDKIGRFRSLMRQYAAMEQIAATAMGRSYQSMSSSQRRRYQDVFSRYIAAKYLNLLDGYQDETLEIRRVENAGNKGVYVHTVVDRSRSGRSPINVEWRVMDRNGPLQVWDIAVDRVSLLVTQRNEFGSMLSRHNGDFDRFIAELEAKS